jgi:hypothetical protein
MVGSESVVMSQRGMLLVLQLLLMLLLDMMR